MVQVWKTVHDLRHQNAPVPIFWRRSLSQNHTCAGRFGDLRQNWPIPAPGMTVTRSKMPIPAPRMVVTCAKTSQYLRQ